MPRGSIRNWRVQPYRPYNGRNVVGPYTGQALEELVDFVGSTLDSWNTVDDFAANQWFDAYEYAQQQMQYVRDWIDSTENHPSSIFSQYANTQSRRMSGMMDLDSVAAPQRRKDRAAFRNEGYLKVKGQLDRYPFLSGNNLVGDKNLFLF